MAKQRVAQLKKIEEEKQIQELKTEHNQQKEEVEKEQLEELEKFNAEWDKRFYDVNNKFDEMERKLIETQEAELKEKLEEVERNFPKNPKPSSVILDLNKQLENVVKQKDYSQDN
jgi:hypothetical protein